MTCRGEAFRRAWWESACAGHYKRPTLLARAFGWLWRLCRGR
jgi:hypothetical protein